MIQIDLKTIPLPKSEKERILFVGTIDYLRQNAIMDLIEQTSKNNQELWIVGKKRTALLDNINSEHVKYFEPTWDVEKYIKQTHKTAGILLGRTTIEGWLCEDQELFTRLTKVGMLKVKPYMTHQMI